MIKNKTPLPTTRHTETDLDKFFTYLVSHVTRTPDIQPIATISPDQSAQRTWTTPQITMLAILATLTLVALWTFGTPVLTLIFALVTILYVALLCLSTAWMIAVARAQPSTPFDDAIIADLAKAPWPAYTILCPLYHEKAVVPQFVQAMKALDYPADCLQVLFLTEEDDTETRDALRAMTLPAGYEIVTVPQGTPKTKPRACNYGLQQATGEYVVIFDAEDVPDPLQLKKAVLTFASNDVNVACVQACLNFYNSNQSLLCKFFSIEYGLWFDLILLGLQRLGFSLPLGGTSNHFRIAALKALGGWDSFNVTEDCDLGLKLAKYNFKTIMLDSTTYEEANSRVLSWVKQRSRWIKGYMQTYLVHTRTPLKTMRRGSIRELLSLHLFIGGGSVVLLINPVMWCMFAVYLIWRPVALYHQLFPWPVLYAGMLCFLVGNFLPIYVSMIACVRREQYSLVKWCLLLPLYWILASVAAFLAGYELIVKPHVWHKTEHGLHLKDKKSTAKVAAITKAGKVAVASVTPVMGNVTQSVRAMSTVPVPAVSKVKGKRVVRARDPWLLATIVLACVCSVAATAYFFQQHELTFYSDALSHMRISRSVFDSATPGLGQLGAEWLPLPHIIMWPFIWNDYLWRTGLAGSFSSMPCYVVASVYIFLSIRRLTNSGSISFVGALAFILNPNVLYLQSTPLSEAVCMAAFATTTYYFLCWVQQGGHLKHLLLMSFCTFLATLARYDGWALFAAILVLILIIDRLKKKSISHLVSDGIMYCVLGGMGIALWFAWNQIIFGSPFYFKNSMYSSQWQQQQLLHAGHLASYHNLWQSLLYYASDSVQSGGVALCLIAIAGLSWFIWKQRKLVDFFAILVFLVPFAFYTLSLYTGEAAIWVAGVNPPGLPFPYFNIRYGAQIIAPIAILLSLILYRWRSPIYIQGIARFVLLLLVVAQCSLSFYQGVFVLRETGDTYVCSPLTQTASYLAQHYNGGYILEDLHTTNMDPTLMNVDFKDVIWEGSNTLLTEALQNPANHVSWIFVDLADPTTDVVLQRINVQSTVFLANFSLVAKQGDGIELFHRISQPVTPLHPMPYVWNAQHKSC